MRAAMVLEELAARFRVYLLIIPVRGETETPRLPAEVERWCAGFRVLAASEHVDPDFPAGADAPYLHYPKPLEYRYATPENIRAAAETFGGVRFNAVHVFRLFLAPFAEPYFGSAWCTLDLDDFQSKSRARLARLYAANGEREAARRERIQSRRFAEAERLYLPRFNRVYLAGAGDARAVARKYRLDNVAVLPNAVRAPARPAPPHNGIFTLLLLGTLDYYPNIDAARYFCAEILPHLRRMSPGPFRVLIAGVRPTKEVLALATHAEVTVCPNVPDVAACYAESDVVIVPLRAGGGSRIKILEAAAHGRPVISTTVGAENLDVAVTLADTPEQFAAACVRHMLTRRQCVS